jgi:GTPase
MNFRSGFVALVGLPNSGKSTLLNCVIGEKVAIVSPKPQTTRRRVVGIVNRPDAQIIFVDSPGVIESTSSLLNQFLSHEYRDVLANSDGALVIIAADEAESEKSQAVIDLVKRSNKPWALVITKADLIDIAGCARLVEKFAGLNVVFCSAIKTPEDTRKDILNLALLLVPESEALYEGELFTTENLRDMVGEIIREKCFLNLHQEIPFGLAVKVTSFKEEPKITRIEADILVEREGHKKMVIGQGANVVKKIGMEARKDIEALLGVKVFLGLHVTCKPRWMQDPSLMRELGYVERE